MSDQRPRHSVITLNRRLPVVLAFAASLGWWLAAAGAAPPAASPTAQPATPDLKTVRAMIEQADAKARTEQLQALSKDLSPLEREWGIKLLGIRLTAAGYALDFRYKILDPDKAAPLLLRQYNSTPYLLVERSGAKLAVPFTDKAGSLRSSVTSADQIKPGRNYSALFANPGRHAKPGDPVTIVYGDFKAQHVVIQ